MNLEPKAIPFIIKNPTDQSYHLSNEAEQFLKNLNSPLSIVTVAGMYRTGKSYLLNRVILNKNQGFSVGPTINPCTKGLWIWNQTIHTQDNRNVLVVDTQGLGALDEETNHDMKIFSLAVLLSTTFIYNSVGNIDENALQTLSLVLNLVGNIDQDEKSTKPSFIWVVRDFSLQLVDDKGNTISPKQYLQMALNSQNVKQSQKAQIRRNISNAFSDRECFTLYKPLIDQNKLQKLDTVPLDELRPQFVSQTMNLRKHIYSNLQDMKLSNVVLTGKDYIAMIKEYLLAINQGKVPNMVDTWTFIKEQKAREITEEILAVFTQKIKQKIMSRLPLKQSLLEELIVQLKKQTFEEFKKLTFDGTSMEQLVDEVERIVRQLKAANCDQMKHFSKNLLQKEYEPFQKKLYSDYYDKQDDYYEDIERNFKQNLLENYGQKIQDIYLVYLQYLQTKKLDIAKYFSNKANLQIKKLIQSKNQIQNQLLKNLNEEKEHSKKYQEELKQKILTMDRQILQLQRNKEDQQKHYNREKDNLENQKKQLSTRVHQLQGQIYQLKNNQQKGIQEKSQFQKEIFVMRKQFDKQKSLLEQKISYLSKQAQQKDLKYEEIKSMFDEKILSFDKQKKQIFSKNQEKVRQLSDQNEQKREKIFELQHRILEIGQEFSQKLEKLEIKNSQLINEKEKIKEALSHDFSNKKQKHSRQIQQLQEECKRYEEQIQMFLTQRTQLQTRNKQVVQELNQTKYSAEKQIAIHMQRIQFHETEIKELKTTNQQLRKNYHAMVDSLQSSSKDSDQKYQSKISDLTEKYEETIKEIEKDLNDKLYHVKKQLQTYKTSKQDLQIQLSLERKKLETKQKQFKESYSKLQEMYNALNQRFRSSQKDFQDLSHEKQSYFKMRIKQLEQEVEQTKQKSMREIQQNQKSSQEALAILKNYSEMERQQWQKRLKDEKEKGNKRIQALKDEYEKRLHQQKQSLQEQNAQLSQKMHQMQKYFNDTLQNLKYDSQLQLQKLNNQFMAQKSQLSKKNALLSQEIQLVKTNMQTQFEQLKKSHQKTLNSAREEYQKEIKQINVKFGEERQFLNNKIDTLTKNNRMVQQQNLILKNQMDKEKALFRERQSVHQKNIMQLEERLSEELFNHTKTLQQINEANNKERRRLNEQIDSLKCSKNKIEQQKCSIEMEKQALQTRLSSKITYLEKKIQTKTNDFDDLMNKFQLTSNFLNNKIQSMQKQKQQMHLKVKHQFEQQISVKEDNYKKENKQYNDRIYRLQTQNKSLRDKVTLLQLKLSSEMRENREKDSNQYEQLESMKEEYSKREEQYRKLVQKLKRDNKKLKEERQILQLTNNLEKSKNFNQSMLYKDRSQRDSIINGLNDISQSNIRQDYSRSRINMDNSKMTNGTGTKVLDRSRISALGENKSIINNNRKSYYKGQGHGDHGSLSPSPLMTNKKYMNTKNMRGGDCDAFMRDY